MNIKTETSSASTPVLEILGVSKTYRLKDGSNVRAVINADLSVRQGETVALVGESGSGKSTLARLALALEQPDSGVVRLAGVDLTSLPARELRRRRIAMQPIFQDSLAAFNPRRTVRNILGQAIACRPSRPREPETEMVSILDRVSLTPGERFLDRYPHELSGGQRQRLGIARALAAKPILLVADEPLSGADVSIRGQVLNLLLDLRAAESLSMLFITHDISVAEAFCDRVIVMYRGMIVEEGEAATVLGRPKHPYTQLLKSAVPRIDEEMPAEVSGTVVREDGLGCLFYHRCPAADERCSRAMPELASADCQSRVACFVHGPASA